MSLDKSIKYGKDEKMTDTKLDFIQWNYINYGMSADFLEYYAEKHPEPPENPFHSDLATILESL